MLQYALNHFETYLLVLLRMVGFIGVSPVLSYGRWPNTAKLGFAAVLALDVSPSVTGAVPSATDEPGQYIVMAVQESLVGILLGFVGSLVFSALTMAGQMLDIQIGFGAATLMNPQSSEPTGLSSWFQSALFTLYFLGMNGLDGLIMAIMNSYRFVPLARFHLASGFWPLMTHLVGLIMSMAVQLAAPMLATMLLTDVTLALLSRAVPQMNVFVVGLPAKLYAGLSMFALVIPALVYVFGALFSDLFQQVNEVLQFLHG